MHVRVCRSPSSGSALSGTLALGQVGCHHRQPPTVATGAALIATVRAQTGQAHQPRHAMFATRLAQVVQIVADLAIAIHELAGFAALRNQRSDALVIIRAFQTGCCFHAE